MSGAAAASPAGQEQIADAVQQTTGFSPMTEPADAPHPALREDHIQNAVAFLAHPKVLSELSCPSPDSCPNLIRCYEDWSMPRDVARNARSRSVFLVSLFHLLHERLGP